jgi:hypothetical protein
MTKVQTALVLIFIVILLWYIVMKPNYETIIINNREWHVVKNYPNAYQAAQLMSDTHDKMLKIMAFLIQKYNIDASPPVIPTSGLDREKYMIVASLVKNYNPDEFYENDPAFSSDTSYTVDKGKRMYWCLRNRKDPNKLVDPNDLLFVIIHECAHVANYNQYGHASRYWSVFKFLLQEAQASGVYTPIDYSLHPSTYCGLKIMYSPMYDNKITTDFT